MKVSEHTLAVAKTIKGSTDRIKSINELYKKLYAMDEVYQNGVFHMVSKAFYECWQAQGGHFRHLNAMLNDALPENVWKVNGEVLGQGVKFNSEQIVDAQILSMLSYIRLTEVKYLEGYN